MSKAFLIILVVVIGIFAGGYYLLSQTMTPVSQPITNSTPTSVITQAMSPSVSPSQAVGATAIPAGWKTYTSSKYGFSLQHPSDMQHDMAGGEERFFRHGSTQSLGTEMYDGILVIIKSGSLEGKTFDAWVAQKYEDTKNDPVQPRVGPKQPITIAGKQGYAFFVSSLGDRNAIYLPKGTDQYIEILNATVEPENTNQGHQQVVDTMLSSLKF